jgi:hypothetical protein
VKLYFSPWVVGNIIPVPAVVGDAVKAFKLVHRKEVCNSLGHVPHLEPSVVPLEIACHRSALQLILIPSLTFFTPFKYLLFLKAVTVEHPSKYAQSSGSAPPCANVMLSS